MVVKQTLVLLPLHVFHMPRLTWELGTPHLRFASAKKFQFLNPAGSSSVSPALSDFPLKGFSPSKRSKFP